MPLLTCPMPDCESGMSEVQRNGVHVDVCPKCRGVWLDPGELEKLTSAVQKVEDTYRQAYDQYRPAQGQPPQTQPGQAPYRNPFDTDEDDYYRRTGKKKSKLGKLFDFFD
jgi:uncharacterized protein